VLGLSTQTMGGPWRAFKVETRARYMQGSVHLLAPADPAGHRINLPGQFWGTPYTWGAAPAVSVNGSAQHLIKLCPPCFEPAPGPMHAYFMANPPPPPGRVVAAARPVHGICPPPLPATHPDIFVEVLFANQTAALFVDIGRHDPPPGCPGFACVLTGGSEIPPTPTPSLAASALNLHGETGELAVVVVATGITRDKLIGSAICLGSEGMIGPPIFDLGIGIDWEDLDGMGIARAIEAPFPAEYTEALMTGQTYINLCTLAYPNGEIRGQIIRPPDYGQGDMNCDGLVNGSDVSSFVLALIDPAAYQGEFPDCDFMLGDCNGDGITDENDIPVFAESMLLRG
jgi:hypothetical protein